MIARLTFAALLAAVATPAFAAAEIQFNRDAQAKTYSKVFIAPAQVEFHRDFGVDGGSVRAHTKRLSADELQRLAREMGESYRSALADGFRKRGFEIALGPGGDVLRISPTLKDLYVNAPLVPNTLRFYVRKEGRARMIVEGSDASGSWVVLASKQADADADEALQRFSPAISTSQRLWFDQMFRDWADELALALASAK